MKRNQLKSIAATFILAFVMVIGVNAQNGERPGQRGERPNHSPEERAEKMTQRMTKKLELSEIQASQVASMNQNLAAQLAQIKQSDLEREEKREEVKALHTAYNAQMEGILSAEQYDKFIIAQERRRDKIKENRGKGKGKGRRGTDG